jgi:hypothetical protein
MGMMIVRHKVKDYGQWRPIFDGHVEMQRAAGLINPRVYHSADSNKSEIVVVFDTEDTKMAKDFATSADLKEAMIKAGVLDTPTIYFLESIDWAKPPTRSNERREFITLWAARPQSGPLVTMPGRKTRSSPRTYAVKHL